MTYIFQKHYSINPEISRQDDIDRYLIEISEAYERSKDFEIKAFVLALESWEYFWKHLTLCTRYKNRLSEIYDIVNYNKCNRLSNLNDEFNFEEMYVNTYNWYNYILYILRIK